MPRTTEKLTRSYIHVPKTFPFSGKTIGQTFNETADKNPDKEMYVFYTDKERKTYKQVQEESQKFAGALLKLGLKRGDTLGVLGANHYEWLVAYIAALQLGLITVHMRMDFRLDLQQKLLEKLDIRVLVLMRSPTDLLDKACQIIPELLTQEAESLNCKCTPMLKYVINAGSTKARGAFSLTELMTIGKDVDKAALQKAFDKVEYDDDIAIFFTSGTTGFPKAVPVTHQSILSFLDMFADVPRDDEGNHLPWESRYAMIGSFGGSSAQWGALTPMLKPSTTIIIAPTYHLETLVNAIQDERVTGSAMMINCLNDMLNMPNINDFDFSSFKLCFTGGSYIPRSLQERAKSLVKHIMVVYGGTEGFGSMQPPTDPWEASDSGLYFPAGGSEVKIIGDDGHILPINTIGEICFRSRTIFRGYFGENKTVKTPSGWYHTGDIGTLNENGYISLSGRKSETIIKITALLAPGDLEMILDQHPAVNNVMVVGVPDERTSEEVCACVRLHSSDNDVTADELRDFCKGKVKSSLLVPKYVLFMEAEFPVTETGKFHRKRIAEQAKKILGL